MPTRQFFILAYGLLFIFITGCGAQGAEDSTDQTTPTQVAQYQCNDALGCVDVPASEPVHIAWMQATSGALGPVGLTNVRGAQVALNEIDFELLGHPIQWDGADSLCTQPGGQAAAEELAADSTIVAIIGPTCAPEAEGGLAILSESGFVVVSPSITHPDLTDPDSAIYVPGFLRTAHNDVQQGRIAAEYAYNQLGLRTAATIVDGSLYAHSLQQAFAQIFTTLGGAISGEASANLGEADLTLILAELADGAPQAIYFPVFQPLGAYVASQKCGIPGLEEVQMIAADALLTTSFPPNAGDCALEMVLTGPYVDPTAQAQFLSRYLELFGEGPASPFAPHAYDAIKLTLAAIEAVAVTEADGSLHIPRQALRDRLYATRGFAGLTGTLACSSNGDCASGLALAIFQVTPENVSEGLDLLINTPVWVPNR